MTKLEELKKLIGEQFEKADATMKTKDYIDTYARMNSLIDIIDQENRTLTDNNAELSKSYKDLVLHSSTGKETPPSDPGMAEAPSFEEMLTKALTAQDKKMEA